MSSLKNEQRLVSKEVRNFLEYWTTDYGFTKHGDKIRCGLCSEVIIGKTYSVKRHFENKHKDIAGKDIDERRQIISQRLKIGEVQSKFLYNSVKNAENMEETIDETPYMVTVDLKPFTESNNFMNIICRVCMSTKCSKLHSIYSASCPGDSVTIIQMLLAISAIPTNSSEEDDVPESVCEDCLDALKKSYDFQQKCINSYRYFKSIKQDSNPSTSRNFNECSVGKTNKLFEDNLLEIHNTSLNENFGYDSDIEVKLNLTKEKDNVQEKVEEMNIEIEYVDINGETISHVKNPEIYNMAEKQKDVINISKERLENNPPKASSKIYDCPKCDKKFSRPSTLHDHLMIHNGTLPFLCSECGKTFNNSSNLRQHIRRHTGVKRFQCAECPSKFMCLAYLKRHMESHSQLKPYVCDICGSAYTKSYTLLKHKLIHSGIRPHVCDICNMGFYRADRLRRHKLIHTGEKPYKCEYCDRAYTQSNDLVRHKRTHVGENTYKCEECPMSFRLHSELKLHNQEHFKQKKSANC